MPSATKNTALPVALETGAPIGGGESARAATAGRAITDTAASRAIVRRPLAMSHLRANPRAHPGR